MNTYRIERILKMAKQIIEQEFNPRKCKYCNSSHVVRFGHTKHKIGQRLLCRDCGHTFMDSDTIPTMKTSAEQITSAVNTFYEGMSLNAIRRNLQVTYGIYPSDSTVYEWVTRYTKEALKEADNYHPKVGDRWVADETVIRVGGKKLWLIDIIDTDTRFLLDTKLSHNRNRNDIREVMETARDRAGKTPKQVLTDGWKGYLDGIELAYGSEAKHIQTTPFASKGESSILIERWHGTLKDRTKVMRGLKTKETAQLILDGWLLFYNYFRNHESLGMTPAQKAGIKFPFANWQDIVTSRKIESSGEFKLKRPPIIIAPPISPPRLPINRHHAQITPKRKPISKPKRGIFADIHGSISRHYFRGSRRIK